MKLATLLLTLVFVAFEAQCVKHRTSCRRYKHFDDYLSHCDFGFFDGGEEGWFSGRQREQEENDIEGSGSVPESFIPIVTGNIPHKTVLSKNKKITCCMLGTMAGDKGYHCQSDFYFARIIMRNRNRAHNRKITFTNDDRMRNSKTKLMNTFKQCVAGMGKIFHKCCHMATLSIPDYDHYDSQQMKRYRKKIQMKKA